MSNATPILLAAPSEVPPWQPPTPLQPGPAMAALKPFHFDCSWTGAVAAGGMGPGSPAMTATGQARFTPLMHGAWLMGDFEQEQFLDGKQVVIWQAHYVVGWDPHEQVYKITYVDNNGSATLMQGRLVDNCFIVETTGNAPVQLRLTWTSVRPGQVHWKNECSMHGSPWFLVEEYLCTAR